jgi:xanthine dehydrogenase YagS FAD-binding subunit
MIDFDYINPTTIDQAVSALSSNNAWVIAGGTELLNLRLKPYIYPTELMADTLVNIKNIPGLADIKESNGTLDIGALASLTSINSSPIVQSNYKALAQAAGAPAFPEIRNMATIGGNISQPVECWFYRMPYDRFRCHRKLPSAQCYALTGDNRYHSIFGLLEGCAAVHVSDTTAALVVLNAQVKTTKRTIAIKDFFTFAGIFSNVLDKDEIVTDILIPSPEAGTKSASLKYSIKAVHFPMVSCAAAIKTSGGAVSAARICMNAVYNLPVRATGAEDYIMGKAITASNAEAAGEEAVSSAAALPHTEGPGNKWMIQIAKTMVKRAILACQ